MSTGEENKSDFLERPPVVVVLGHVDHGKTTILDNIRKTRVVAKEAGGITQHIGAYQAEHSGKKITFLDTPGHEAFAAIRSRGAKVADLAILVVAADEGLKLQSKEAIEIIKQVGIPFIVAINKMDKESANPQKVRQELAENEVLVEDYGGQVPVAELSATKGEGIKELLELILLTAELEDLSFSPNLPARGVVIESHLDNSKGIVATLLVLDGTLKLADWIVAGHTYGKIKSMEDFRGKVISSAVAADPVVVLGWQDVPRLGGEFICTSSSEEAEKLALVAQASSTNLFARESSFAQKKTLHLIIKADVLSSLEAIDHILHTIHSEEVDYKVISYGAGNIGAGDVKNAIPTKSIIIGFHVRIDDATSRVAERNGITIKTFDIIYKLVEFVREAMGDLLAPEIKRIPLGRLKILATFKKETRAQIVGGKIVFGKLVRGAMADVVRGNNILVTGRIGQLQSGKQDVVEAAEGYEVGIRFDMPPQSLRDIPVIIREADILDVYQEERTKRSL